MVTLTPQAKTVATTRYFLQDENHEVIEDADGMFKRVAKYVAQADSKYGALDAEVKMTELDFFTMMERLDFIPNSPTLMNAGTGQGTLSACFVLPIEDSMEGIMKAATDAAMVQKFGGGTGYALSLLRSKGTKIRSTHGVACGPIEVLKTLSRVSSMITQGGKRDGANMAVMSVYHPDIREFITCKTTEGELHNFNISVAVDSQFMEAAKARVTYPQTDPSTGKIVRFDNAGDLLDLIIEGAWKNGEPGMIFMDRVNRDNKVIEAHGEMIATNPCGEQPLLPNESCNLGSINLANFFEATPIDNWRAKLDWERLETTIKDAVHFLDNIIDVNTYATPEIHTQTHATRKIGLGVMGFADLLIQLRIAYDSELGREVGEALIGFIKEVADETSINLGKERGVFPSWKKSEYQGTDLTYRNACRLTVAPTGTISMLADTSSGVEPTFALAFRKSNILEGKSLYYVNKYFERDAKAAGFYSEELMEQICEGWGTLDIDPDLLSQIPDWFKETYITAADIAPEDHVKMQAVFQAHIDSGISKTINFGNSATIDDVRDAYMLAWTTECKGITVYRQGSRDKEVLTAGNTQKDSIIEVETVGGVGLPAMLTSDITQNGSEQCCDNPFITHEDGCWTCKACAASGCSI